MGKAMFTIIGAMAELESALISERVTAGKTSAVKADFCSFLFRVAAIGAKLEQFSNLTLGIR